VGTKQIAYIYNPGHKDGIQIQVLASSTRVHSQTSKIVQRPENNKVGLKKTQVGISLF
jgi:hypothetical protein